jgi:lipopolysaccharide assembly outer membrane protein LptD (OstA)
VKQTIFAILAFASAIAMASAGQVNPAAERKHVMIATPDGPNISLTATAIQRQASIVQLRGNVEIRTRDMILRADEANYNQNTGEIEADGSVRIKLEAQR